MFANADDAKNLTLHADGIKNDGLLCHPTDSPQWKTIHQMYLDFGQDPRNLRVGLDFDEINPFGNLSVGSSGLRIIKKEGG